MGLSTLYDRADEQGEIVDLSTASASTSTTSSTSTVAGNNNKYKYNNKNNPLELLPFATEAQQQLYAQYKSTWPLSLMYLLPATTHKSVDQITVVPERVGFIHGYLFRKSAYYRSSIAKLIHLFRSSSSPHLPATAPCVVAQFRRGDRLIPPNIDPREYCFNAR